jgi:hypothetical protein
MAARTITRQKQQGGETNVEFVRKMDFHGVPVIEIIVDLV